MECGQEWHVHGTYEYTKKVIARDATLIFLLVIKFHIETQ